MTKEINLSITIPDSRDDIFSTPEWSGMPHLRDGRTHYLEVLRDGSDSIARYDLSSRKMTVIGSNRQMVQVPSYHTSISRQHVAVVYHKIMKEFYLIDLQSFTGTFIGEERIEAYSPTLVSLDQEFSVGKSSRKYKIMILESGNEFDEMIDTRPKKKQKKEEVHVFHLLVKHTESRNPVSWRTGNVTRTKEEAMSKLLDYKRMIEDGDVTFQEMATKYSDCTSGGAGGELRPFGRGKMQPPFEAAAFALKVGEISDVVDSDSGLHIIVRVA